MTTKERWLQFVQENWPHAAESNHAKKVLEEGTEFALSYGHDSPRITAKEAADIVIVLWTWAAAFNVDLDAAIEAKIEKNMLRTWEFRDGVYKHVKEG